MTHFQNFQGNKNTDFITEKIGHLIQSICIRNNQMLYSSVSKKSFCRFKIIYIKMFCFSKIYSFYAFLKTTRAGLG